MQLSFRNTAIITIGVWLTLVCLIILNNKPILDNVISLSQLIFYVITFFSIKKVYYKCDKRSRQVLIFLLIAIILAVITNAVNYSVLFILKHDNFLITDHSKIVLSKLDNILHYADYIEMLIWYIIMFIFLYNLLKIYFIRNIQYQKRFIIFASCLILFLTALLYLSQPEKLKDANFFNIVAFIASIIEIATFIIALYGLIHSKSVSLYLLLGSIIVMAATQISALFYYSYYIQEFLKFAYIMGVLWIILLYLAFVHIYTTHDYQFEKWFVHPKTLEAKLAFLTLVVTYSSFIAFFSLAYIFNLLNEQKILSFFFALMIYSVLAILAAKRIAYSFASPFQQLQSNISKLISNPKIANELKHFQIIEFDFLQNYICDCFVEHENQNKKINTMGKKARQVAHDIRSPAAAIMMLTKNSKDLPEEQRILLRNAATRVQDIANNILNDYQQDKLECTGSKLMVAPTILTVVSEKRAQYADHNLNLSVDFSQNASFSHIDLDATEFKCMLSNMLNNAIEAINDVNNGEIKIDVQTRNEKIIINIQDNGCGMSSDLLELLNDRQQIISTKKFGFGLGLEQARQFVKDKKAELKFSSELGYGTIVSLVFPMVKAPCWLINNLEITSHSQIIVLDDDQAIHNAWEQLFSPWLNKFSAVSLIHFQNGQDCIKYIESISNNESATNIILLADYELIDQPLTGLDVIEKTKVNKAILVTSYFEDEKIIKRAILSNTKILPKMLASEMPLQLSENICTAIKDIDGILLDDQEKLSEIILFLAKHHKLKLDACSNPYELWKNILLYPKGTPIFIDYDLGLPVHGIDIAEKLWIMGYTKLYLATGYKLQQKDIPSYVTVLEDKMSLLKILS